MTRPFWSRPLNKGLLLLIIVAVSVLTKAPYPGMADAQDLVAGSEACKRINADGNGTILEVVEGSPHATYEIQLEKRGTNFAPGEEIIFDIQAAKHGGNQQFNPTDFRITKGIQWTELDAPYLTYTLKEVYVTSISVDGTAESATVTILTDPPTLTRDGTFRVDLKKLPEKLAHAIVEIRCTPPQ